MEKKKSFKRLAPRCRARQQSPEPEMKESYSLGELECYIDVEGVTLVLPSRLFMFNEYWRILALS